MLCKLLRMAPTWLAIDCSRSTDTHDTCPLQHTSSVSAAHYDLGLSTLSSRRKLHLSQSVLKCLSSQCLSYIFQLFSRPNSSHHTQLYSSCQLNLPFTRSSFGQRSFSFTGASMWRSLPANIHAMKNFRAFSAKCEDFLLD